MNKKPIVMVAIFVAGWKFHKLCNNACIKLERYLNDPKSSERLANSMVDRMERFIYSPDPRLHNRRRVTYVSPVRPKSQ